MAERARVQRWRYRAITMKTFLRTLVLATALLPLLTACGYSRYVAPENGPGMTVTYSNGMRGKSVDVLNAISAGGQRFPVPGFVAPSRTDPMLRGKVMGAAPDGRALPEWVAFEWKEWPYPYPAMPPISDAEAYQKWKDADDSLSRTVSRKSQRVLVRDRVPSDVVDAVMQSKQAAPRGKLADKSLWIYFVWFDDGIKFRWKLEDCCNTLRAGGDAISGAQDR